ncbi:MAG: nicotinate (nicotinamide) nucleotide adenylyltransferase [Brevinematia bacterium]
MRVGLFGGSFDPIHIAHLMVAQIASEELDMDKVIFIPAKVSPLKVDTPYLFTDSQRLEMLRLATKGNERFEVSDFEISLPRVSYTYLTVEYFYDRYKGEELFLIVGGDSFESFCKWKNYKDIVTKVKIVVYPRENRCICIPRELEEFRERIIVLNGPLVDISSTMIRERIKHNKEVRYFLPCEVYNYIVELASKS